MDTRRIQTSVMLDPDVKHKLKKVAANNDDKISNLINRAVRTMFDLPRTERNSTEREPAA